MCGDIQPYVCVCNNNVRMCPLGSKVFNQQLKDVKVPVKYQGFQDLLLKKVELINKHQEDGPPILNWQQILG